MIGWHDVLVVALAAASAALLGSTLGGLALRALRHRSIRMTLMVVALTSVVVVAAAIIAVGALMLVSGHALAVLVTAVVAAGVAGLAVAAALGRSVVRSSSDLQEAMHRLGGGQEPDARTLIGVAAAEWVALGADLDLAHRRLAMASERERALEASRRELVAWVSHDLRTPLAGLRALAEALEDGVVTDEPTVQAYHRQMLVEVERLAMMINDLFELSRINAGALRLTLETVDLGALVTDAAAATAALASRRGVRVVTRTGGSPSAIADADQMERVLHNLLSNAIRHTPDHGTVTVSTSSDVDGPLVTVGDECGGIPEGDLPRLFDVGFRGSRARTPDDDHGGGLGLAIATGIVAAHRGRLAVTNVPGGCRFEVRLPGEDARSPGDP